MFCSTIIPTIGRESLGKAVESVLSQNLPDNSFEVIVVNDSGKPLRAEAWQHSDKVRIISTNCHNRSVARNTGAALAKGRYLHFLDDDDWILPGTFERFWRLANVSAAAWLYGAFRLTDNTGKTIIEVFPEEAGNCFIQLISWEWLPLQASMIQSEAFFAVGGFDTLAPFSAIFQDIDLSRRIACHYEMAQVGEVVTCIRMGEVGSTTNYAYMFIANRKSREKAINNPGSFTRMIRAAHNSSFNRSYWYGKIAYYYLASAKWHVQGRNLFTALSRTSYAFASFVSAGKHLFAAEYWRGISTPHFPRQWSAVGEYEEDLFADTKQKLIW